MKEIKAFSGSEIHGMNEVLSISDYYAPDTRLFWAFCERQDLPFSVDALEEWVRGMKYDGYAAATIRRRFYAIKTRLRLLVDLAPYQHEDQRILDRYELERRCRQIPIPNRKAFAVKPTKFFSLEEIRTLIQKTDARTALIVEFLYSTGLRISEMCSIRKRQIRQDSERVFAIRVFGKGNKERVVFINSGLRRRIEDVFHGHDFLFESERHTRLDIRNVWKKIVQEGERILGRHLTPHCLRHSFVAHKIRETGKLTGVSLYLGHSDISITLGEYNNEFLSPEELASGLWGDRGRKRAQESR